MPSRTTRPDTRAAATLPAAWYHDPAVWDLERERIFGREWQYVAPHGRLAETGQYVRADVAGQSIVVTAGGDGRLHGFHNVCLHRAGPLVWDDEGRCGNVVCRYHGWAYDLDGRLRSARDFGDVDDSDHSDDSDDSDAVRVPPVRVESWRGLVFVNLDPDALPLGDWLGGFGEACDDFAIEDYAWHWQVRHEVRANWKTYCDNYGEGYHIPTVHPTLHRAVDSKQYEVVVGEGGRWTQHLVPARNGAPTIGRWLWRYPNLALNLYPTGMNVERFLPLGPTRTEVVFDYFFLPGHQEEAAAAMASSAEIMDEDVRICEAVQRNLEAGVYGAGLLSPRHEQGLAAMQALVRAALTGH